MSDVFISYARADQAVAAQLRDLLDAEGWDVWWDQNLYAGARWETSILTALKDAKVVIGLWSARATGSEWVQRELESALAADKLVPCSLDATLLPPPYDVLEAAILDGWPERVAHPELPALLRGLERHVLPRHINNVRPGFDLEFLGTAIEFPELPGVGDELPYLHFSVVINPARRLPWYVAYNIEPQTEKPQRENVWQPDPRLSRLFQPSDEHFRGSGFDRGHLVSPSTVAWGESRHANIATRQTFFWANMAPQAPAVNRFSWLALENGERNLAHERGRVVGFSGPVLAADDPLHSVTDELRGRVRARQTFHLPRAYWKVVASFTPEGHELQVSAYVVANSHERLPPEPRPLAHIEQLTGLAFPGPLRDASPAPDLATPSAG